MSKVTLVLRMVGKAEDVFGAIRQLAKDRGKETLGSIVKGASK